MPLPQAHLLDELATAYIQALAASSGAIISVSRLDYGVDGTLKHVVKTDDDMYIESGFPVDFQLKGTSIATIDENIVKYDLKARNYDLIATRPVAATPYYLFLVCFGSDATGWLIEETGRLVLSASAFWWTLSSVPTNNTTSRFDLRFRRVTV